MNKNQQSVQESKLQTWASKWDQTDSKPDRATVWFCTWKYQVLGTFTHSSKLKAEKNSCEHIILHLIYDFSEDIFQTLDDPTYNSSQTVILFFSSSQIISAQEFNFL